MNFILKNKILIIKKPSISSKYKLNKPERNISVKLFLCLQKISSPKLL